MSRLILFNKPYGVLCQFSPQGAHITLKDYLPIPDVYPAGRLDVDSEGLLILTDDGSLQHRISAPQAKLPKTYWVQVEGIPHARTLDRLQQGLDLGDFVTRPAQAQVIAEPASLWSRDPPIRSRKNIPTSWLSLTISEGKNRQVRRMTATIGHPTLRLIRATIGPWNLDGLISGAWCEAALPDTLNLFPQLSTALSKPR